MLYFTPGKKSHCRKGEEGLLLDLLEHRVGSVLGPARRGDRPGPDTGGPAGLGQHHPPAHIPLRDDPRLHLLSGRYLSPTSGLGIHDFMLGSVLRIRIRDLGWVKNQDADPGWTLNNPNHISESLDTLFWAKILKFFDADPGSGMEKIRIWDKHPGSATLIWIHNFCANPDFCPA